MAIQTIVNLSINLIGDGTSTTFTIPLANLTPAQQGVLYGGTPSSAVIIAAVPIVPSSVAITTIAGKPNIVVTYTTAPALNLIGACQIQLGWNG